jgi:hypothetical protein
VFEVLSIRPGLTVVATASEVQTAQLLLSPLCRAAFGMGDDSGGPLPGVNPHVETYVRRERRARRSQN